ncbi:HXXEE domain-containing protein [Bacillus horti]|uniref:HXXEE domain-containing protein n=1 Tax=Caldalkalibacillus horti TaxID=77523 RepID=A0ABT9VX13_9BACI|nr:HXXEE domain-containing protein [Bacillus horti]MDQ0165347.1 hypothetical protein [Bacillus horti]
MDFQFWIWMFLIVFMLHNFEEIFTIEHWFKRVYPAVKDQMPTFVQQQMNEAKTMTAGQFTMAVFVLFVPISVLLPLSLTTELYFLFLGANLFFALNIITHPLQALFLRRYVPGLWTSIFIILPYNLILFNVMQKENLIDASTIGLTLLVALLFIPLLFLSHSIGEVWRKNCTI